MPSQANTVALFTTCLVELFRPQVVDACRKLLEGQAMSLVIPGKQACCGQPAYSGGDADAARKLARQNIALLQPYQAVVIPSGSCAATMISGYPRLLAEDERWLERAHDLSQRCFELSQFLAVHQIELPSQAVDPDAIIYHDACTGLRELGLEREPRQLLAKRGYQLAPLTDPRACCGFGGAFALKFPELSGEIGNSKALDMQHAATQSGATIVTGPDLGCLLHLAGCLHNSGSTLRCFHLAEVLAGQKTPLVQQAAIGESGGSETA